MSLTVIYDVENTVSKTEDKEIVGSPYPPDNSLVSVAFKVVGTDEAPTVLLFDHPSVPTSQVQENVKTLQDILAKTSVFVAHNAKHDLSWLYECGFEYDGKIWDTMMWEYVHACGRKAPLDLDSCLERHGIEERKLEIDFETIKSLNASDIIDYNSKDIAIEEQLYLSQVAISKSEDEREKHLHKAVDLMNDFLPLLVEMERNGTAIDVNLLQELEVLYRNQLTTIEQELKDMVVDVMGDKPYNLNSPDDLSAILYSRTPLSKTAWKETFNIGSSIRGAVKKKNKITVLPPHLFAKTVNTMKKVYKTEVVVCTSCNGSGYRQNIKQDGTPYARKFKCKWCLGDGVTYKETNCVAGLKLKPINIFAVQSGFASDKRAIEYYMQRPSTSDKAKVFLSKLMMYNKISSWLGSFINNIRKFQINGVLHTNFNQCITATGRLSSSRPNLQNQPKRDKTFLIRKVFTSRYSGGKLIEADFGQLEFRIAALLSGCPAAIEAIKAGLDIHSRTRDYYHGKLYMQPSVLNTDIDRQAAKLETFGPLYGKETEYTKFFYAEYPGIEEWHTRIMEEVIATGELRSPSGRIYKFPGTRRYEGRDNKMRCTNHTQIKNYPVQGFATGDVVILMLIELYRLFKLYNLESKIVLQVHDSVLVDAHPDELDKVPQVIKEAFDRLPSLIKERWGFDTSAVELNFDLAMGDNWYDQEGVKL